MALADQPVGLVQLAGLFRGFAQPLRAGAAAAGQSKTLEGDQVSMTVTIEAIEQSSRTLTVKTDKGLYETIQAPPGMQRFSELKVGDKITARYYENVVVRLKQPGEKDVDSRVTGTTGSDQVLPGGTKARQLTMTATIAAIDMNAPSVTFTGPNGWKYLSKVQDTEALAKVKVGDKVEIVWTEAVLVSLERDK